MEKTVIISYLITTLVILRKLIVYALIARILSSWFTMGSMGHRGRIVQFLYDVTDPFINCARLIPHQIGMIDLSPMIAMLGIDILGHFLVVFLTKLA